MKLPYFAFLALVGAFAFLILPLPIERRKRARTAFRLPDSALRIGCGPRPRAGNHPSAHTCVLSVAGNCAKNGPRLGPAYDGASSGECAGSLSFLRAASVRREHFRLVPWACLPVSL